MSWLARTIEKNWQRPAIYNSWLAPLWLLFVLVSWLRQRYYQLFPAKSTFSPVVVVGNISVGGTGKTPLIDYLLKQSAKRGLNAGVIARGYGAKAPHYPFRLTDASQVEESGDEPFMLYQNNQVPFVIDPVRPRALQALMDDKLDVVFSDDGLQHYALARDYEIVVVDKKRGFGNGWRLPIGPLREPVGRLKQADMVLTNGQDFSLKPSAFINLKTHEQLLPCEFVNRYAGVDIKALAGIGNPERFFMTLKELGLTPKCCALEDHHAFSSQDLADKMLTVMTEKDAVKSVKWANTQHWYLKVDVCVTTESEPKIDALFKAIKKD